jgi:hypothetical protein
MLAGQWGGGVTVCAGPRVPAAVETRQPGREDACQIGKEAQEDNNGCDGDKNDNVRGLSTTVNVAVVVIINAGAAGIVAQGGYIPGGLEGGMMEDDDDKGHCTMAATTTAMIISEYINEAVGDGGARHSLRPKDAMGLFNMRLVSLLLSSFYQLSSPF